MSKKVFVLAAPDGALGGNGGGATPIQLSALPDSSITTQAGLDAIGLTVTEIQAAAQGQRTGVTYHNVSYGYDTYYPIAYVDYSAEDSFKIVISKYDSGVVDYLVIKTEGDAIIVGSD